MSLFKENFHKITTKFADDSTIHGFKDIKDSTHNALKIAWVLALCFTVAFLAYQTKYLLDAYDEQKTASSSNNLFIDDKTIHTVVYCSDDWINLE